MKRTLYILGAFGKLSHAFLKSKLNILSHSYKQIYLIDVLSPPDLSAFNYPANCRIVKSDVKKWISTLFKPESGSDFLFTIGKDYPYTTVSELPEQVFFKNYDEFTLDFYLNAGYIYDILSKCELSGVEDMTFVSFDSIYSDVTPRRSLYNGKIKPIIYGLGKSQLSLISKCVRENFHHQKWCFYNLRLGAVSEVGLPSEFVDKYKLILSCAKATSISSVVETTYFLLEARPESLSGSTLDLTLRD